MGDKYLLIIWHSRTGSCEALADAAFHGAGNHARITRACDVEPKHLLDASGYLFVCPENLASMSGEMKEMFDRCYYPVLSKLGGRPYATIIAAGTDGLWAQRQLDRIATGWRLKRVSEPWIVDTGAQTESEILERKTMIGADLEKARELGQGLATGIAQGIF
ncbi:flavodoxin family protein [Qipengyuania sphaerica]|uniref:flavodoxin family protein n=1 Tax=Qipengyuania sphaerica TaxID=2867243 RepID=UPI001C87D81C|nr:NAD(P)H-dependent oxidoreductase [Qipengyuania sphaerica]MBX7540386.1 NAD(P)H-dependent oxidoreductase [Qipengyuania sphaerica]